MGDKPYRIRRLHRAGNSAQLCIPADMMHMLGLKVGDSVWFYVVGHVGCFKRFDDGGFTPEVIAVRSSTGSRELGVGSQNAPSEDCD